MTQSITGVHAAAATPITAEGQPDTGLYTEHCRRLLDEGCHGLALLGTTGEATSFGLRARLALFESALAVGLPPGRLLLGTGAAALSDSIELTRQATAAEVRGCLVLPPFYYKGLDDEGLFRFYAGLVEAVADDRLRIVLYHIPQFTCAPFSHDLIARLLAAFPGIVCGIKDSSGDLDNMTTMADRFPGLAVFAGADPLMLPVLRAGGAGCITAAANLCAPHLRTVWDCWSDTARTAETEAAQTRIVAWRKLANRYPQIPAIKAMLAKRRGAGGWARTMPPLVELDAAQKADLHAAMAELEARAPSAPRFPRAGQPPL